MDLVASHLIFDELMEKETDNCSIREDSIAETAYLLIGTTEKIRQYPSTFLISMSLRLHCYPGLDSSIDTVVLE